ncbi:SMI1/KNR4 family protein [Bradyrhizobium sp. LjRoot220]|uniref:SMI1/KNR4 family protein n=1 Tax=Bradyrhizobium sp. LjRoot220 TaxID=3342284 RepID=UPI003ED1082D
MYLAKFFHRPPGDDDRELLLIPGNEPIVIGIYMDEKREIQRDDFLREEFSNLQTAITAFRRHAAELVASGYVETTHTKYTLRNLLPDPQPKPNWQKGLDDLMLAALSAPLEAQEKLLEALGDTQAADQPLYLWLAAHHGYADDRNNDDVIALAECGRDTLAAHRAAKTAHYAWSIYEPELTARIFEVLSWAQLRADNPAAALEAIEEACKASTSQDRGVLRATILCDDFPERQEEAFDAAYKCHAYGGYEEIIEMPAYADYVARRKRISTSDKAWRWHTKNPASEDDLRKVEEALGTRLPKDYREFLAKRGESELQVRLPKDSAELCFYRPAELATQRENLFDFIARDEKDEADAYFREAYGVAASDLLPIAEPAHYSRCLVINLGQGERFGWCFQWDHDGAWELEHAAPSFDAALKALTDGIAKRDATVLKFLGVYLD